MGAPLNGVLQVEVERFGRVFTATTDLALGGTIHVVVFDDLVATEDDSGSTGPSFDPSLHDQLRNAFAKAMGLSAEDVHFH
jgi:hypothetical protein